MEEKQIMVIGGGVAGLIAARNLAGFGAVVHLVEQSDFLGGHAISYTCKATTECLQCGACAVEKVLKEVTEHPGIKLHRSSGLSTLSTEDSRFSARIEKGPYFIDLQKCINCGLCYVKAPGEGLVLRSCSKNNHPLYAITKEAVVKHRDFFAEVCPEGAIDVEARETGETVSVEAIVVATGFSPFDPGRKPTYGYADYDNVISGLDMERIKRKHGTLVRPSDGRVPEKVAFIQCVGSRDERLGNLWCSRVCCPYALRSAKAFKHRQPESEVTVFYMDIQNIGKSFTSFNHSCKSDFRFIRAIPVDVFETGDKGLMIRTFDEAEGTAVMENFDMLVLSTGILPNRQNPVMAELLGIGLDMDGFFAAEAPLNRTATTREGIFIAGTAGGPNSIAGSMAQAGQAAEEVLKYLGVTR